jgi:dephospho-CoA kinase
MSQFLITGRGGSGKSTIAQELLRRQYTCFDADDVAGLARWEDLSTGLSVNVDHNGYVDYSRVGWNWNETTLSKLLNHNSDMFLCGSASNQLQFHSRFDKVFVLILSEAVQAKRLLSRTDNGYGKHPDTLKEILHAQQTFVRQALDMGATAIDAEQSVERIVDDILVESHA